jgi:hypothetical protein
MILGMLQLHVQPRARSIIPPRIPPSLKDLGESVDFEALVVKPVITEP